MIIENRKIISSDRREQARLALSLVDGLGLDGAIFACRANGWDGVLDVLIGARRPAPVYHD